MRPSSWYQHCFAIVALALGITMLNAAKPLEVDDTYYYYHAAHLVQAPADPYGFDIFWWDRPTNANEILCPLVVPYWYMCRVAASA